MNRAIVLLALLIGTPVFGSTFQCGELRVTVEPVGDHLRLNVGEESFDLRPVVTASGAKYEAVDDASTSFWSKGRMALVEIQGERYPECTEVTAAPFRATGNEPFWRLDIGDDELTLVTNLGETRVTAPTPQPERGEGVARYSVAAAGQALAVTVLDQLCTDTMTGMPYPSTVIVRLGGEELRGCGGDPASLLHGDEWVIEAIEGETPVLGSSVSLAFADDGRVGGAASCNRFMGGYALSGEGLTFSQMATTMMACPEELMAQEQRFLKVLAEVIRFEIGDDGALVLYTGDGRSIRARRP